MEVEGVRGVVVGGMIVIVVPVVVARVVVAWEGGYTKAPQCLS